MALFSITSKIEEKSMSSYNELKKQAEICADTLEHLKLKDEAKSLRLFIAQASSDRQRLKEFERKRVGDFW